MTTDEKLAKVRWNIRYYTEGIEKHQLQIEANKAYERELMAQQAMDDKFVTKRIESADIPAAPLDATS